MAAPHEGGSAASWSVRDGLDKQGRLMMHLAGERLMELYKAFRTAESEQLLGLSPVQFANAIASALPKECWEDLGEEGVSQVIVDLFSAIDVNGDVSAPCSTVFSRGEAHSVLAGNGRVGRVCGAPRRAGGGGRRAFVRDDALPV
jgi:hypothetical protein